MKPEIQQLEPDAERLDILARIGQRARANRRAYAISKRGSTRALRSEARKRFYNPDDFESNSR